jgi:hypothetical protein
MKIMKIILITATLLFGITTQSIAQKKSVANKYNIGNLAHGGIVFWVDETGEHGLVCAKEDQSTNIRWYNGSYIEAKTNGTGNKVTGRMKTFRIMQSQGSDFNSYAAGICANLKLTVARKTYNDWYLPTMKELLLMYRNQKIINAKSEENGGHALSNYYWSSSEFNENKAHYYDMNSPLKNKPADKETLRSVRAVRAF